MTIRISDMISDSIVDGPGLRLTVFTQGCFHNCPQCHNPQTHDPNGGKAVAISTIIDSLAENPLLDGITLSGGEPFEQPVPCQELAGHTHSLGLTVWLYTGYTWESLWAEGNPDRLALIKETDVIVDGLFRAEERSLDLLFCGSKNQRLIDVKKSLEANEVVLWEPKIY